MRVATLGEVCDVIMGQAPPGESYNDMEQGVPLLAGAGDFGATHPEPKRFTTDPGRVSDVGDILLCVRATIGERNWSDRAYCLGRGVAALRVRPGALDSHYLWHWLPSAAPALARRARGSTFKQVTRDAVESLRIALPPLAEQRRVAAVLDKADAVRRKRRESLRLLDEFLRSAFLEMFGDPVKHPSMPGLETGWRNATLDELKAGIENACSGGPFGSSLTRADYVPEPGVPVIRGNNLVADLGHFRDEDFVFVTEKKADQLKRNLAFPGDIIFTQRGTLGQVAQIPRSAGYARYVVSQSQMKLTVDEEVADPTFVVHYFLSPRAKLDLEARTLATGVPHINLSILRRFPIVLPPLALQNRFSMLAARHSDAVKHFTVAGGDADKLFDSLAQRAFGERPS